MNRFTKLTIAAALATASCSAVAAPASAVDPDDNTIRIFKVTAEGSGTFSRSQVWAPLPQIPTEIFNNAAFSWKTQLPYVGFYENGEAFVSGDTKTVHGKLTTTVSEETVQRGLVNDRVVTTRGYCEAKNQTREPDYVTVITNGVTGEAEKGADLTVRPFDGFEANANCTAAVYGGQARPLGVGVPASAFDQTFHLPAEATRQGKIIQLVEASPAQKNNCLPADNVTKCAFDWKGTLTFEFVRYQDLGPDDLPDLPIGGGSGGPQPPAQPTPPAPPTAPAPGGPSTPTPAPDDLEDIFVPIPTGAKLSSGGKTAALNVRCSGACRGTVTAFAVGKGARSSAAAKPLAKVKFKSRAGKPAKVKLRFRGSALRKVRKGKGVRLVVDTGTAKKSVVVRLR